jgi:SAM-dependent MidA family methyltransferase
VPAAVTDSDVLRARIAGEIDRDGPIPFARFMARALYEPEIGYYTGPREKIGQTGDFYTSLDVHPVFGRLIGVQVAEMARALPDGPFTVVEMGAGKGLLAYDVLREIRERDPDLFARLAYRVVEVSPDLIRRQRELLREFESRITWHARLEEIEPVHPVDPVDPVDPVQGVFVSNELVDALPHHQVVMTGEGLMEVFVTHAKGRLLEVLRPPSTPAIPAYLEALGITLPEGYRTEIPLAALDWMRAVAGRLSRGYVLTVDYGYPADVYYRPDRTTGTFLCHHEHKVSADPYARIGAQDMTAHVDFSSLARTGRDAGLVPLGLTDQGHFLLGLGVAERMAEVLARDGGDPVKSDEFRAMRRLMDPLGMGKTFKVFVQEKGIESPRLSGLRFAAYSISDLVGTSPDKGEASGAP